MFEKWELLKLETKGSQHEHFPLKTVWKQEAGRVSVQQSLSSLTHIVDLTLWNHTHLGAIHIQNEVYVAWFNLGQGKLFTVFWNLNKLLKTVQTVPYVYQDQPSWQLRLPEPFDRSSNRSSPSWRSCQRGTISPCRIRRAWDWQRRIQHRPKYPN